MTFFTRLAESSGEAELSSTRVHRDNTDIVVGVEIWLLQVEKKL